MSDSYNGRSVRRSVNAETFDLKSKPSRNEIIEKLLVLLTTDVPELAKSLWDILDSDKEGSNNIAAEIAKLKRENEHLRRDLEISRKDEEKSTEVETKYKEIEKSVDDEKKLRKEYERKYQELKQGSKKTQEAFENEKFQMEETIKKQKEKIQALEREEGRKKEIYRSPDDRRDKEQDLLKKYTALEEQHRNVREKLKKTEEELDETKTRLSQALGLKLLDNNPNIADLSDKYRPTKLAEIYQEIYDKEWTDAFECIMEQEGGDEIKVISALVSILMETKTVCEKEAEKQMEQMHLALTQDETRVDNSIISNINKQLKECRKQVAPYSGKQVFKKYYRELKNSYTSTARKAKLVPKYLEACFNVCWLMTVQDPPVVFGPNIKRGDTFDTDLYKAYTQRGVKVEYVVWPALLLNKSGPVLCKGIAQGISDDSNRPKSASIEKKDELQYDEIDLLFFRSDKQYRGYKDDMSITERDIKFDTLSSNGKDFRREDDYERQRDSSNQTYLTKVKGTYTTYDGDYNSGFGDHFSSLGNYSSDSHSFLKDESLHCSPYNSEVDLGRGSRYTRKSYAKRYYPKSDSSYRYRVESDISSRRTKVITPRPGWK